MVKEILIHLGGSAFTHRENMPIQCSGCGSMVRHSQIHCCSSLLKFKEMGLRKNGKKGKDA